MLEVLIREFLDDCKISNFADKSIESLKTRLKEFGEYIQLTSADSIRSVTYMHIREFVGSYMNPSEHIRKSRIWAMRILFHYLKSHKLVEEDIGRLFPYPKIEKKVPEFLTIEEYNSLLKYFIARATDYQGLRNLVIIMILGLLGLRLRSVISIDIEDLDIAAGLLWVKEKGRKERLIILPGILCDVLEKYLRVHGEDEGPLLLSKRGKRISPRTFQDILRQASLGVGIEKHLHAHLFRHTAATHLNRVSGPDITQYVLGHMWRKNTDQYTHLNPEEYAEYMRMHPYMKGDRK
jgi:integrase/recombinase XerC